MAQVQRLHHDLDWAMCAIRTHRAVLILDLAGDIVAVNQPCLRLSGYRREELIGRSVLMLLDPMERTPNRLSDMLEPADGRDARIFGLAQMAKSGRRFRVDAQVCPIRDEDGQPCLNVLFLRDSVEEEGPLRAAIPALAEPRGQVIELPARFLHAAVADTAPPPPAGFQR
ncbi:PAS domain-containing protein [Paracoccus sp. (in: a-proteobacteria)]|uniref:PAS domain-containing protein n=1 Tax=Paracoccus sp. TaxID=267 RepID=UPI0032205189